MGLPDADKFIHLDETLKLECCESIRLNRSNIGQLNVASKQQKVVVDFYEHKS